MEYNLVLICLRQLFEALHEEESKETLETFLQLLNPFCPHITEELWERLGNKTFLATTSWPSYKETKINPVYEEQENYQSAVKDDIRNIIKLVKSKPRKIHLFLAPEKNYALYHELKKETSKELKELMNKYKHHGPETIKIIQNFIKGNLRLYNLTQHQEQETLEICKKELEQEFSVPIMILPAEKSKEPKAQQAQPGKPAVLIL